ncbi:MAG: type II toxin-antitoxin system VapC family toxin [Beijerinckiaceae bacterium]
MTGVLVDSNVLLDIMTRDPRWFAWSSENLNRLANRVRLVINPIIYAEVSTHHSSIEQLDDALPQEFIAREPLPYDAAFLAAKCYLAYRRRGGARRSPLPDFFIGAHASVAGYELLTRDASRYRTYFPKLKLLTPQ